MVVLETTTLGGSLLGGPYAQGAPALKILPKRYLGLHQWLGPVCTKELKEQVVSEETIGSFWVASFCYDDALECLSVSYCGRFLYPRVIDGEMPSIQIDLIRVEGVRPA